MTDVYLRKIADSMDHLADSIDRYTTLQAHAELYKCGIISENEYKVLVERLMMPRFIFKAPKAGKEATDDSK